MTGGGDLLQGGPVEAVLFDYGLTLVDVRRPVQAIEAAQVAIARRLADAGFPEPSPAQLLSAVHDRVEAEVAAHEKSGALEEIDIAEVERQSFADIGLRLDERLRDRCTEIAQEAWFQGVIPYPEALPALSGLRAGGLRLGLCSNAPYRPASMHEQLRRTGLAAVLDAVVFSGEVGWRKPSPRLFERALAALGARADTTVFVGDRMREDVEGAHASGMRAVLLRRRAGGVFPGPFAELDGDADAVIGSLLELPGLLLPVRA